MIGDDLFYLVSAGVNLAVAFGAGVVTGGVGVWWRMTGSKGWRG